MKPDFEKWLGQEGRQGTFDLNTAWVVNLFAAEYAAKEVTRNLLKAAIVHDREKKQEAIEFAKYVLRFDTNLDLSLEELYNTHQKFNTPPGINNEINK